MATIESLLAEEAAVLAEFLAAIEEERQCLSGGDLNSLPAATERKSVLAARLSTLEAQRETLLGGLGLNSGRSGIERWLERPSPHRQASIDAWKRILALAARAKRENEINGKLIAGRLQQNHQALGTLLGSSAETNTYGADGQRNQKSGRRTLGSA